MSSPVAAQHLRELAAGKSKIYELLLALEQNPQADDSCWQSLAGIVDRALFNEISLDSATLRDLGVVVSKTPDDLGSTLAALDAALSEGEPERENLRLVLVRFPAWLGAASESARPHFLAILPVLAPHMKDLGNAGVESIVACFNACVSEEDSDLLIRCVIRYQETSGEILRASVEIASLLLRQGRGGAAEQMLLAVTPEAMFDSKDSRLLLPAIAKLMSAGADDAVRGGAAAVCLATAKQNHSSALNLARQLPEAFAPLPVESRVVYLRAFESIVETAGISMVGYCCKQLPALFQKAGVEPAAEFVAQGVAIAHRYGKIAAQEFFERKTAAAKQASPQA